ncbi:MAG: Glutathione-regulated potassium-efflux system protein KefB [Acidobacteria bacterium]|nr:Glutathione-regulated potassium-efflux system protein KefB [Acidobacteriota bacterium]
MPHDLPLFTDLLILLLASIPIAFICHRLRLPVIVGFMITGVMIGPSALGFIKDAHAIESMAEIGVALLLFTIGLEFSLQRLMEMKRLVLGGGGLQVVFTILIVVAVEKLAGRPTNQAVFFGFLFALSSTAIVLKSYMDRMEIDTIYGRASVGILLFQDLCIVPMMLLVPMLSGQQGASAANIALTLGKAAAVIAGIVFTARTVVPFLLFHIVRLRSPEVFIIFVVLVSLGAAWLTSHFGLSMALGAFIAGLVLSESEYSHQIVSDILPFRDVFNSIFFMSIGMLLSPGSLARNLSVVMVWLAAVIIGKAAIVAVVIRLLQYPLRVAVTVGLGLAQVGEFSFVLAKMGVAQNILSQNDYQLFLAASILSMIATPFLINAAPKIGFALQSLFNQRHLRLDDVAEQTGAAHGLNHHVIVVGYGINGRNLTKVLHRLGIQYLVLELNAETVRAARAQGVPIQYGDAGRQLALQHAGAPQAAIMVLAISDPVMTRHAVALAREMNPDLHIIVRTRYMSEVAGLFDLGASEVVPEEFETSVEIFSRVLRQYGVSRNVIEREVEEIRKEGYGMLRSTSLPLVEMNRLAEAFAETSTETVFIGDDSPSVGRTLKELDLRNRTGATATAIVRNGNMEINPGPEFKIEADDILVLIGRPGQIGSAAEYVREGKAVPQATGKLQLMRISNMSATPPGPLNSSE